MIQNATVKNETLAQSVSPNHRARVILDLSGFTLSDQPALLEEKFRRTTGIVSVEINVFSKRINVEFDSSMVRIEEIRAMIRRR
jgi:hypothetical protein